ncbi:MAG: hypothetical protein M3Q99_02110 [Acidobacteriota bacterium]|nr:hypothetical protein [Acidobacteriota bacterium]
MPLVTIVCGVILIIIGFIGYIYGMSNGNASLTALIPALFGLILAGLGAAAQAKEDLRKHLMHAAVTIGLLGFLMTAGRLVMRLSQLTLNAATVAQIAMSLVCLIFVILCIKSFVDARRNKVV